MARSPLELLEAERPTTVASARRMLRRARAEGISYHPSPVDWRDEVLYFLLPDRFSDERTDRPLLTRERIRSLRLSAARPDISWQHWAESGGRWQGGTLKGIESRLGYLASLGVTAIWVGPIFKQRARLDTFHGYGVQDFMEVDPRFGTRQDAAELVAAAHQAGLRVILDVIVNHSGDNWGYQAPGTFAAEAVNEPPFKPFPDYYGNPHAPASRDWQLAWRDEQQLGFTNDARAVTEKNHGVWPTELRDPSHYTRAGAGSLGAGNIDDPHAEHKRTDFLSLKDFALDAPDTLSLLSDVFKYWVALLDCDGFRIDTVKHIALEDARAFCGSLREFADSIGKRDFLLIGEIAGGDDLQDFYLDRLGVSRRNLSAALDIGGARLNLQATAKGLVPGDTYLESFKESASGFESHRSLGDRHASILDDHDHVFGRKLRFSAEIPDDSPAKDYQVVVGVALQLFTLGIPCLYYGTEQAFSGPSHSQLPFLTSEGWGASDRFLREAMFGPEHPRAHHDNPLPVQLAERDEALPGFGPFGTFGAHCFDERSPAFLRIQALCATRSAHLVLRVGRQYSRRVRVFGAFVAPAAGELIAWSRLLDSQEAVVVVNPNGIAVRGGQVTVDANLSSVGDAFLVIANTQQVGLSGAVTGPHPLGSRLLVQEASDGTRFLDFRDVAPAEVIVCLRELL